MKELDELLKERSATTRAVVSGEEVLKRREQQRQMGLEIALTELLENQALMDYLQARDLTITLRTDEFGRSLIVLNCRFISLNTYGDNTYGSHYEIRSTSAQTTIGTLQKKELVCVRSSFIGRKIGNPLWREYATAFAGMEDEDIEATVTEFVRTHR